MKMGLVLQILPCLLGIPIPETLEMDRRHQFPHSLNKVVINTCKVQYCRTFQSVVISHMFFLSFNTTVGLQKILSLLESDDANVRIHAVKVVANLAAEGA